MSLFLSVVRRLRGTKVISVKAGPEVFKGNYDTWEDASAQCSGYSAETIFEKTKTAALAVRRGEALFERDSVLFHREDYAWQVVGALNSVAAPDHGRLSVLDFGGSLGSAYFQNRKLLHFLPAVRWCVVEQPELVAFGKAEMEDDVLRFCGTIGEAVERHRPNVVLFGSVLQYLPSPHEILRTVFSTGIGSIVIDRTAFHAGDKDRLTIQRVSPEIYDASYPAWFLSLQAMKQEFERAGYRLVTEWICDEDYPLEGLETSFRGMFFERPCPSSWPDQSNAS